MTVLRFAVAGTGFWSCYQLAAWRELHDADCVALYNRTRSKADALAREFGIPAAYEEPEEMLKNEKIDFLDIITELATRARFVRLAAEFRLPVICQKPMARVMFAPVMKAHRVTVEQMAILEPALAETASQTCMQAVREGMDEAIRSRRPGGRGPGSRVQRTHRYLRNREIWIYLNHSKRLVFQTEFGR